MLSDDHTPLPSPRPSLISAPGPGPDTQAPNTSENVSRNVAVIESELTHSIHNNDTTEIDKNIDEVHSGFELQLPSIILGPSSISSRHQQRHGIAMSRDTTVTIEAPQALGPGPVAGSTRLYTDAGVIVKDQLAKTHFHDVKSESLETTSEHVSQVDRAQRLATRPDFLDEIGVSPSG
jgi:hypothetical protein